MSKQSKTAAQRGGGDVLKVATPPRVARRPGVPSPVRPERSAGVVRRLSAPDVASTDVRRNPLLRFLAIQAAIGAALGQLVLIAVLATDIAGLGSLVFDSATPLLPLAVLSIKFAITMAAGVVATGVMLMPYDADADRGDRG